MSFYKFWNLLNSVSSRVPFGTLCLRHPIQIVCTPRHCLLTSRQDENKSKAYEDAKQVCLKLGSHNRAIVQTYSDRTLCWTIKDNSQLCGSTWVFEHAMVTQIAALLHWQCISPTGISSLCPRLIKSFMKSLWLLIISRCFWSLLRIFRNLCRVYCCESPEASISFLNLNGIFTMNLPSGLHRVVELKCSSLLLSSRVPCLVVGKLELQDNSKFSRSITNQPNADSRKITGTSGSLSWR